jgi:hypothetical protein
MAPPGSKRSACKQSYFINVGDPKDSFREESIDQQV